MRLAKDDDSPTKQKVLDGDGHTVALDIPLVESRGQAVRFGNLGNIRVWIDVRKVDDNIGCIAFNGFFNPPYLMKRLSDATGSFMEADGLIIDLRGNGGGMGAMAMDMAGWLLPENRHLGSLRTRDNELKLIVQPRPTLAVPARRPNPPVTVAAAS